MRLNERLADYGLSLLVACESRKKLRVVGIYFAEQPPLGDSRLLGVEVGEKKLIFELRGGELLGGIRQRNPNAVYHPSQVPEA